MARVRRPDSLSSRNSAASSRARTGRPQGIPNRKRQPRQARASKKSFARTLEVHLADSTTGSGQTVSLVRDMIMETLIGNSQLVASRYVPPGRYQTNIAMIREFPGMHRYICYGTADTVAQTLTMANASRPGAMVTCTMDVIDIHKYERAKASEHLETYEWPLDSPDLAIQYFLEWSGKDCNIDEFNNQYKLYHIPELED